PRTAGGPSPTTARFTTTSQPFTRDRLTRRGCATECLNHSTFQGVGTCEAHPLFHLRSLTVGVSPGCRDSCKAHPCGCSCGTNAASLLKSRQSRPSWSRTVAP